MVKTRINISQTTLRGLKLLVKGMAGAFNLLDRQSRQLFCGYSARSAVSCMGRFVTWGSITVITLVGWEQHETLKSLNKYRRKNSKTAIINLRDDHCNNWTSTGVIIVDDWKERSLMNKSEEKLQRSGTFPKTFSMSNVMLSVCLG